jgi:hypothetical protein
LLLLFGPRGGGRLVEFGQRGVARLFQEFFVGGPVDCWLMGWFVEVGESCVGCFAGAVGFRCFFVVIHDLRIPRFWSAKPYSQWFLGGLHTNLTHRLYGVVTESLGHTGSWSHRVVVTQGRGHTGSWSTHSAAWPKGSPQHGFFTIGISQRDRTSFVCVLTGLVLL